MISVKVNVRSAFYFSGSTLSCPPTKKDRLIAGYVKQKRTILWLEFITEPVNPGDLLNNAIMRHPELNACTPSHCVANHGNCAFTRSVGQSVMLIKRFMPGCFLCTYRVMGAASRREKWRGVRGIS